MPNTPTEVRPLFNPPEWEALEGLIREAVARQTRLLGEPIVSVLGSKPQGHSTDFAYMLVVVPNDWISVQRLLGIQDDAVSIFGGAENALPVLEWQHD